MFQSRQGRNKQRMCFLEFCHKYSAYSLSVSSGALFSHMTLFCTGYAADGSRLVAGVVAISSDKKKVLVVESTNRKNHWVLPKGGYETDEASAEEAAARKITLFFHYSIPFFPTSGAQEYPQATSTLFFSIISFLDQPLPRDFDNYRTNFLGPREHRRSLGRSWHYW